jgi:DNA-binding response OmpR family regulator
VARILIVEPYPEVRELLALIVERMGHAPVVASTHAAGSVDLLLVEPATRGALEIAQELRAESPTLPIVVVSFLPQPATWSGLEPAAYVLKPFTVAQLAAAVASALPEAAISAA